MQFRKEFALAILVLVSASGCRFKSYESMVSSSTKDAELPYKGDPYTFGGLQEGTGGQIAASKSSMETETYSDPKFKKLAGPDEFVSMTGHSLGKAKPSDTSGDYQPLPSTGEHSGTASGPHNEESGH